MATPEASNLNKLPELFRGCMVGALLGDCLGEPFENEFEIHGPKKNKLSAFIHDVMKRNVKDKLMRYTDDTVMTRGIAQSLIEKKTFDAKDMAKRFTEDFFQEDNSIRNYGGHVPSVFMQLKKSNYSNVLEPAQSQFSGTGSYGNGAAMRVAPVPLFSFNQDLDSTINLAKQTSLITHAHHDGYNGAILLSLAIKKALQISNLNKSLDVDQFLDELISEVDHCKNAKVYESKLMMIKDILKNDTLTTLDIAKKLGNYVTAPKSVPIAIYAFLRALKPINDFETDNAFVRTMFLAISCGGDTDTIACMAGGIAGAYYGINQIPEALYNQCEGIDYTIRQADQLLEIA